MNKLTGPEIFGNVTERFDALLVKTLRDEREEKAMKHKRFVVILLAALLVLALAATALAFSLQRSPYATAVSAAREAVYAQYGFTPDTFGVFINWDQDNLDRIVFEPQDYPDKLGTYTVELKPGEEPVVHWSYEEEIADLAELATRGLDSPIWGHAQLERALTQKKEIMAKEQELRKAMGDSENWTLEEWAQFDAEVTKDGGAEEQYVLHILPSESDIQREEALTLAVEAIQAKYGVDAELVLGYKPQVEFVRTLGEDDLAYDIEFMEQGKQPNEWRIHFWVKLASPSGNVASCRWYEEPAKRTLPEGALASYHAAVEEYVKEGAFDALPADQKAEVAKRITEAGFGELIGNVQYQAPQEGEITVEEATAAADAALQSYGFTEKTLALFDSTVTLTREGEQSVWSMKLKPSEERLFAITFVNMTPLDTKIPAKMGEYTVQVDARSGEVQSVVWSQEAQAENKTYTASNWGVAPVLPLQALPFVAELNEKYHAISDPIEQAENIPTLEEQAAMDGLFRDAGFDAALVPASLPGPDDLPYEEAKKIAMQALCEEYGVTEAALEECFWLCEFTAPKPGYTEWCFGPQNAEGWYGVVLDAKTGEILLVNYLTGGNG